MTQGRATLSSLKGSTRGSAEGAAVPSAGGLGVSPSLPLFFGEGWGGGLPTARSTMFQQGESI